MRSLNSVLDRFCAKHRRLGIPNLMLYIVIGNIAVFFLDQFSGGSFSAMLTFNTAQIFAGQIWRILTFIIVPMDSNILFLALSMYLYWSLGTTLEREWGTTKFTVFYALGVILNIVVGLFTGMATMSYVNLSIFFAFATLYPNMQFILIIIPIKAKWLALLGAVPIAISMVQAILGGHFMVALLPVAAILNYLIFFSGDIAHLLGIVKHKANPQTINFKAAQKKAQETHGYIHKCAVCGKTDQSDPTAEFRYCSKCNGYHCYCMDHINNHIHIE
ncbi:MAG: rhomboid family intramembrane serine protease [Oscillospiraceae bacterium]